MIQPDQLELKDIDPWLLSGEPVVRLWGRDFDYPVTEYVAWLRAVGEAIDLPLVILEIKNVPGIVVQAYSGEAPVLKDPLLKASKTKTPWLYCCEPKCKNRTPPGASLGGTCEVHK